MIVEENGLKAKLTFSIPKSDYSVPEFMAVIDDVFSYFVNNVDSRCTKEDFCDALNMYIDHHMKDCY